jgi:hypothetical protein
MRARMTIHCTSCGAAIQPATARRHAGLCAACAKKTARRRVLAVHEASPGCPSCDGTRYTRFNWKLALETKGHEIDKYPKCLRLERRLKVGVLYGCPACHAKWYLDDGEETMSVIPAARLPLLDAWNSRSVRASSEVLLAAAGIGATSRPQVLTRGRCLQVPCDAVTKAGQHIEMAMLLFQSGPPIDLADSAVGLVDELARIEPSAIALPARVRLATTEAHEVRMGLSPTIVMAPDGQVHVLNGTVNFFTAFGIRGQDIVLSNASVSEWPPMMAEEPKTITYFVGDWFPELERLAAR